MKFVAELALLGLGAQGVVSRSLHQNDRVGRSACKVPDQEAQLLYEFAGTFFRT